jgi:uncharacterized protein YkwD
VLNTAFLLIGFLVTLFTLSINLPTIKDNGTTEVKGVKIDSQPIPYYPAPTLKDEPALVLSDTNSSPPNSDKPTSAPVPTEAIPEKQVQTQNPVDFIMNQINSYRIANGLFAFESHSAVCGFAEIRLNELQNSFSHSGFDQRLQNGTFPYPGFSSVAENIADSSSYTNVFEMWQNSRGHNQNLLSDLKYACVARSGRLYVFESWSP